MSYLELTSRWGPWTCYEVMMAKGANEFTTREEGLCYLAALQGNAINVAAYLQRGANIVALSHSPLLGEVAKKGHIEVLRILLDAGFDINYSSEETRITALMQAARAGQLEALRFLLERGACVGDTPQQRYHTLSWAVPCDDVAILYLLLAHGVEVTAQSASGYTAFMRAASNGSVAIIRAMLLMGANMNAVSSDRLTALRCARRFGQLEAEAVLKEAGAQEIPLSFLERFRDKLGVPLLRWTQSRTLPPRPVGRAP